MAVGSLVSVEEYLNSSYRPDRDYVDGELLERNVGERKHGRTQREIILFLTKHYPAIRERLIPEQRVQVSAMRFRIPDICVLATEATDEEIVTTPPALCIEILSPADTVGRLNERIKDYFQMGVPVCWIIDPVAREAWNATPGHWDEATDGILRAGGIEMPLAEVLE